jgi:hypothetical protein
VDNTPASSVRVAATVTSVDVIGAASVCPVGALEHVAGKDVDGVGHPQMGTWLWDPSVAEVIALAAFERLGVVW